MQTTVTHPNGATFKVIPADSHDARIARNIRTLTMADGTTWTVGSPIGWRGIEAAWQTVPLTDDEQAARQATLREYGESMARRDRRQVGLHLQAAA